MSDETLKDLAKETNESLKELNTNFKKLLESPDSKVIKPKKLSRSEKKKGFVNMITLGENNEMDMVKVPVDEMTTTYDKVPRLAKPVHVYNWKGTPTIIQPLYTVEPVSPELLLEKAERDKTLSVGFKLLTNRQEMGEIKGKKGMPPWLIWVIIIGIVGVAYFLLR